MKKVFTLLSLMLTTVCAIAQTTFSGTWHSNPGNFADFQSTVTVTVDANGRSTIAMNGMTLDNDNLGDIVIRDIYTEQNGSTYTFNMGTGTAFDITNGNLSDVTSGTLEGYGTMDSESLYIKASWFEYGTKSLRMVVFNGTKINTPDKPDGPQVVSTETFSDQIAVTGASGKSNTTADGSAVFCEYSDGTYGITLKPVVADGVSYGTVTFNGLKAADNNGTTVYTGTVTPTFDEDSPLYGKNISADVTAEINDEGNLLVNVQMTDADDSEFFLIVEFGSEDEPWTPGEPASAKGTLSAFTATDDGNYTTTDECTLTFTETAEGVCSLLFDGVSTLPGTSIAIGSISIPGVAYNDADDNTTELSAANVEATTKAEHPYYATLTIKKLSGSVEIDDSDEDNVKAKANISFTVDNNSTETIEYTFTANGTLNAIGSVNADGSVSRIYTISGINVKDMQRGINIVRNADGKTVKVVKK